MKRFHVLPLAALPVAALLGLAGFASAQAVTSADRFQLWNECRPVRAVVKDLNRNATRLGLEKAAIERALRGKLEDARIYEDKIENSLLFLDVHVVGNAFSVRLEYKKLVRDIASDIANAATTWVTGGTGSHDDRVNYIMSGVSQTAEQFIDEYLRVNAKAC